MTEHLVLGDCMFSTKNTAREEIGKIIKRYERVVEEGKEGEYNEADVGSKFIIPLIEKLGWNVKNIDEVKEQKRTVFGPADYSLNVNGKPKILIEIKKFENLDQHRRWRNKKQTYSEQAINYAWSLKADWAVLTNFRETRLYYSHVKKPEEGLIFKLTFREYIDQFDKLWLLSHESVVSGVLDTYEKRRTREEVDIEILKDLYESRVSLSNNIHLNNPEIDKNLIRESVQKILDRLLVIRVAEDRHIIPSDSILTQLEAWEKTVLNKKKRTFMMDLKNIFRDFDSIYDTKLFEEHICENLKIDNDVIKDVIDRLYKYNFDLISSDVLGAMYENYIGHVLRESEEGIKILTDEKIRKSFGIYYTPEYVVDYIVKNTVGEILKDKKPEEVSKIRILDPACGSGSFLIKAFDYLKEYYEEHNKKIREKANTVEEFDFIQDIEKKILKENLYGVDLDEQAAEIASVNLILKALSKEEKLPLILDKNIKVGNSLISGSEEELKQYFGDNWKKKKPFNWEEEFPEIFEEGGFDIVIGNPPYGADLEDVERKFLLDNYTTTKNNTDTAAAFINRAFNLLKKNGYLGLIVPKPLTYSQKWLSCREFVRKDLISIVDVSKAFKDVLLEQVIIILKKNSNAKYYFIDFIDSKRKSIKVEKSLIDLFGNLINDVSDRELSIAIKLNKGRYISDVGDIKRGLIIQQLLKQRGEIPVLRGKSIGRYLIKEVKEFITREDYKKIETKANYLLKPKIIIQNIVAHVTKPKDHIILMATIDKEGLLALDNVGCIFLKDTKMDRLFLLALLNSTLMSWYAYKFIYAKAIRTMRLDKYHISKMPLCDYKGKPEYNKIITLADKMLFLNKQLSQTDTNIDHYINQYPREKDVVLQYFVNNLPLSDRKVLNDPSGKPINTVKGKIKEFEIVEEGEWLVFKVGYVSEDREIKGEFISNVDAYKCRIEDANLRKFLYYTIKEHVTPGKLGKGNIYKNILTKIKIPKFDNNEKKNKRIIDEIMGLYLKEVSKTNKLKREIEETDKTIDNMVYKLYGLTDDEIKIIEESFQ